MKKGDAIVCIDDISMYTEDKLNYLTMGKVYIINDNTQTPSITDDNGELYYFRPSRFKLLSEIREEKINELLK